MPNWTVALLIISAVPACGQWTQLTNTKLSSVCPANGVVFSGGTISGIPYTDDCFKVYTSWSGGAVDTLRNRLIIQGDGHDGATDNALYSLDISTRSTSTGTNCGAATNCSTNANAPTLTRLNDPTPPAFANGCTAWASCSCSGGGQLNNTDGSPVAMQTYQTSIYLRKNDRYWVRPTGNLCDATGPDHNGYSWIWNPSNSTWTRGASSGADAGAGTMCAYDTTYVGSDDAVLCMVSVNILKRYLYPTDSWTTLANAWTIRNGATIVVDPDGSRLFFIGPTFTGTSPAIMSADLAHPTNALVDWTGSVTGCANLMGNPYPGLVWDASIHKIVGYQPMTAASPGVAHNVITVFDPTTNSCSDVQDGGGPAAASSILAKQGNFGRFNLMANGVYVVCNNSTVDCYSFNLPAASAMHGSGGLAGNGSLR